MIDCLHNRCVRWTNTEQLTAMGGVTCLFELPAEFNGTAEPSEHVHADCETKIAPLSFLPRAAMLSAVLATAFLFLKGFLAI